MSFLPNELLEAEERNPSETAWPFMEKRRGLRIRHLTVGESMTKSDMAEQCDINVIMAHYAKNKLISHFMPSAGRYEDLPDVNDYHSAMNLTLEAQRSFELLPAGIRDRFANDPARLLAFLNDPKNRAEAETLGIVQKPPSEAVPPAPPPTLPDEPS